MIKNFKLFKDGYTLYNKNKSNINIFNIIGVTYLFSPLYVFYDNYKENKLKYTINNSSPIHYISY